MCLSPVAGLVGEPLLGARVRLLPAGPEAGGMSERREMRDLVTLDRAREVVGDLDVGGGTERVPLGEASGRVLAERVDADLDVPGFDRASVDGYAVRAVDTTGAGEANPVALEVGGLVEAGERPDVTVGEGAAVEIATGAVVPPGANAVVMVEDTTEQEDTVEVRRAVPPGGNVMAAGADIAAGDRALGAGVRLTPRTVGLLAAMGHDTVAVRRQPKVAVVATGEELVQPGADLDHGRGQIYDVNTETIATGVREAGGEPVRYTRVPDDRAAMADALREAAGECDMVLTAGSTSASGADMLYSVVEDVGDLLVHGVALKPGKPTIVGQVDGTPYVGLPGYPVSALSVFRLLVAPRLRRAAGYGTERSVTTTGRLAVEERYDEGRRRALPVGLVEDGDGETVVYPVDKGSGATTTLAAADGVVDMPADTRRLRAGEDVTVELFSPDARAPPVLAVGESDPAAAALLDAVEGARYLTDGDRAGRRWLRDGVADVAVLTGEVDGAGVEESEVLTSWDREWGVVAAGGDLGEAPLETLAEGELSVATVNRDLGLRAAVDDAARAAGLEPEAVAGVETAGIESPARRVADGRADAGVALRATAEKLDLPFTAVGVQSVSLVGNGSRLSKDGVQQLREATGSLAELLSDLPGYTG
jgi:putative molybdopterin biosynthesis protein